MGSRNHWDTWMIYEEAPKKKPREKQLKLLNLSIFLPTLSPSRDEASMISVSYILAFWLGTQSTIALWVSRNYIFRCSMMCVCAMARTSNTDLSWKIESVAKHLTFRADF